MERQKRRRTAAPIVLALLVVAALVVGLWLDREEGPSLQPGAQVEEPPEVWRCVACARITGKNWTPCRTVTARGTEKATGDLATRRVCEEAADPESGCQVFRLNCRTISDPEERPERPPRVEVVEE